MKYRFIQVNCIEGEKPDLRQAEAILKYKPDIVLLEYPNNNRTPNTVFNNYSLQNKPVHLLDKQIKSLEKHTKEMPWVVSDIKIWRNIGKLWNENQNVLIYKVDAPSRLVNEWFDVWKNMYPCAKNNWLWWVRIYLREKYMEKNVQWVLDNAGRKIKGKGKATVLVFLQSFHWKHVQFLLENHSKEELWEYYFGKFTEVSRATIGEKIRKNNKVFYRYWNKISDFVIQS